MTSGFRSRRSRRSSGQPELPHIFINRSLGKGPIRAAIVKAGFASVRTLSEVFGESDGQFTDDDVWIAKCAEEGWTVLTKDRESLLTVHRAQIEELGVKTFILPRAYLSGAQQIERIVENKFRIAQKAAKRGGPALWLVRPKRLEAA